MKAKKLILIIVLLSAINTIAVGDRQLDRAEILQIFQTLTDQPRRTWIPAGIIEATRLEYKTSNGYVTDSNVIVKYDGDRFYWEINIDSHTRETAPEGSSNDDFDLNWNKKRVFVWDGERYTMYFRPGNHAIVTENPTDIPVTVNGPLTAGIVPWGYGVYTYQELTTAESSAIEIDADGQKQVYLTLNKTNMPEMVFVLDPTKSYAVLSCSFNYAGRSTIIKTYGDYELFAGKWIPTTIIIERYDDGKQPSELLSYNYWNLTSINVGLPQPDSFNVAYELDALVEYDSPATDKHLFYRYSNEADTDSLLQDKLAIALGGDTQARNCATVAMKYVAEQLGKNIDNEELIELVNEPNKDTSLYEMRQFAEKSGFHCLAVKTDIATLKNLNGGQAILHLPAVNHYVVLGHIDDKYVWLIDLDGDKFYYRTKLDVFGLDWSEGAALLLSNEPLVLTGTFTNLDDSELHKIIGSSLVPNYSCTDLIQSYNIIFCSEMILGLCGGRYIQFQPRYGCIEDINGGNCSGTGMIGNIWVTCIEDPHNPGTCVISGDFYSQYIRACK